MVILTHCDKNETFNRNHGNYGVNACIRFSGSEPTSCGELWKPA